MPSLALSSQATRNTKFKWKDLLIYIPYCFASFVIFLTAAQALGINLSGYSFAQIDIAAALEAPSQKHIFGTDALGRDLFSRILYGGQMSLSIAVITALIAFIVGVSYGSLAATLKRLEEAMLRFIDFIYSLPDLLVLSLIALMVSRSTSGIIFGLAFISWMDVARLTRSEISRLKKQEFIEASRALGLSPVQILTKHLLPNSMPSIIVALSFTIPRAILAESTLSFIGLGLSPPACSWGTLAGDAWQYMRSYPHLIIFPALFIFLTVLSFNLIGEHLREKYSHKAMGEHLLA